MMDETQKRAERVVRNGRVAVLISPGYGAGWSSWGDDDLREEMVFCPRLVLALEAGKPKAELHKIASELFPGEYLGGIDQLRVEWVVEGEPIRITEYDGSERIQRGTEGVVTP
jgi:hypothetical protein